VWAGRRDGGLKKIPCPLQFAYIRTKVFKVYGCCKQMEKIYYMGYYYSPSFALMAIQEFVLFFFGIFIIIAVLAACYV
jgi:hypothetical protein